MAKSDKEPIQRILYLVPAFPAVSETFVYREIAALQKRNKSISLCALYQGEGSDVKTPELESVTILYTHRLPRHILSLLSRSVASPVATLRTAGMFLKDWASAGFLTRQARALAYQFLASATLASSLKRQNIQHVHAHFAHSPTQVAMYASKFASIGFSFTGHANDIFERGFMLAQKAKRATQMVTISDFNRRHLIGLGVASDKVSTVRVILEFPKQDPALRSGPEMKLGSLGRLVPKKGMDILLNAISRLDDTELTQVSLEIGGDGPEKDRLMALAEPLIARGATITFRGQLNPDDVSAWMRSLDAFVLACRQTKDGDVDGIPVVLMEAIASGVPVISTDLSGVPELIRHEQGGLISAADNPQEIAEHFRKLLNAPDYALRLSKQAQDHLFNEFDPEMNIDRFLTAILNEAPK